LDDYERERFDEMLEALLAKLPPWFHDLLERAPLFVHDRPDPKLLTELGMDEDDDLLCGLHTGTPLTERSVQHGHDLPEMIHLFREGIIEAAGGWDMWRDEDDQLMGGVKNIAEEIRITLLHEVGHHFGLEEEDLEELGYD
jgi:predicted Zn-dependent protease with MMP-like domain